MLKLADAFLYGSTTSGTPVILLIIMHSASRACPLSGRLILFEYFRGTSMRGIMSLCSMTGLSVICPYEYAGVLSLPYLSTEVTAKYKLPVVRMVNLLLRCRVATRSYGESVSIGIVLEAYILYVKSSSVSFSHVIVVLPSCLFTQRLFGVAGRAALLQVIGGMSAGYRLNPFFVKSYIPLMSSPKNFSLNKAYPMPYERKTFICLVISFMSQFPSSADKKYMPKPGTMVRPLLFSFQSIANG